jgi:predicted RNase H-like HicB family nuclease
MGKSEIMMTFKLPIKLVKRKNWYLAKCPALDVASQGETPEKAKENLIEAISLFVLTCMENGTFESVLKDCGFSPVLKPIKKETAQLPKSEYVDIPIHLLTSEAHKYKCHV